MCWNEAPALLLLDGFGWAIRPQQEIIRLQEYYGVSIWIVNVEYFAFAYFKLFYDLTDIRPWSSPLWQIFRIEIFQMFDEKDKKKTLVEHSLVEYKTEIDEGVGSR